MEGHRGTLTSQAWLKRANRLLETRLHNLEAMAVLRGKRLDMEGLWTPLLTLQFHDILCGTAIHAVFEEARKTCAALEAQIDTLWDDLLPKETTEKAASVINLSPYAGLQVISLPQDTVHHPLVQDSGGSRLALCRLQPYAVADFVPLEAVDSLRLSCSEPYILENSLIRATLDAKARLISLWDKTAEREVLSAAGNIWQTFEDRPLVWDAWDIDPFFEDRQDDMLSPCEVEIVEQGPLRIGLRFTRLFGNSRIEQTLRLSTGSRRLDFDCQVDWRERHRLVKVAFPLALHSPSARYHIQWGSLDRPSHENTSWDQARFEAPAQHWVDMSEGDYGCALLNDCKYGYDAKHAVLRLTLIKSSTMPDPEADQGLHRFTYALLPHSGDWRSEVDTRKNLPLAFGL